MKLPLPPLVGWLQAAATAAAVAAEEAAAKAAKEEEAAAEGEEEVEVVSHAVRVKCYTQLLLLGALDRLQVQTAPTPMLPSLECVHPPAACLPPA